MAVTLASRRRHPTAQPSPRSTLLLPGHRQCDLPPLHRRTIHRPRGHRLPNTASVMLQRASTGGLRLQRGPGMTVTTRASAARPSRRDRAAPAPSPLSPSPQKRRRPSRGRAPRDVKPRGAAAPHPSPIEPPSSDWKLHPLFPFMAPNLLWRTMAVAGFLVYVLSTLLPLNPFTGGSQLNATLTFFQSVILWKAPRSFGHEAKRALCTSCFLGYSLSAGVTLSDMFFSRSIARFLLWLGSFVIFYLGAQANMCYLILDSQATALSRQADLDSDLNSDSDSDLDSGSGGGGDRGQLKFGVLRDDFSFEGVKGRRRAGLPAWRVVFRAFSRVLGLTVLSFSAAMAGKLLLEAFIA